jgi:hypothetical protein
MAKRRRKRSRSGSRQGESPRIKDVIRPEFASALIDARRAQMKAASVFTFEEVVGRISSELAAVDPVAFLSAFCFHTQLRELGDPGEVGDLHHTSQFQVELLQAILLRDVVAEARAPSYSNFVNVHAALRDIAHLDPVSDRKRDLAESQDESSGRQVALDAIRTDAVTVRNWGVPSAVERIVRET